MKSINIVIPEYIPSAHVLGKESIRTRELAQVLVAPEATDEAILERAYAKGKGDAAFHMQEFPFESNIQDLANAVTTGPWSAEFTALDWNGDIKQFAAAVLITIQVRYLIHKHYGNSPAPSEVELQVYAMGVHYGMCGYLRRFKHEHEGYDELLGVYFAHLMAFPRYTTCAEDTIVKHFIKYTMWRNDYTYSMVLDTVHTTANSVLPNSMVTLQLSFMGKPTMTVLPLATAWNTLKGPMFYGYADDHAIKMLQPSYIPLGKALAKLQADNEFIKGVLTKFTQVQDKEIWIIPNDMRFKEYYRLAHTQGTITSCMSKSESHYGCEKDENGELYYPLDPYSTGYFSGYDNGLVLILLRQGETILSRTIADLNKMKYVRMYGDYDLSRVLSQMGIEQDGDMFCDNFISKLEDTRGRVIGPYLDGSYDNVEDTGRGLFIIGGSGFTMTYVDGVYSGEDYAVCERCEGSIPESEAVYLSGSEITVCQNCYESSTFECPMDNRRYLDSDGTEIRLDGDWTYVADCNIGDLWYDDEDDCYYLSSDEMVELRDGGYTHVTNAVELLNGDWVLQRRYDRDEDGPLIDDDEDDEEDDDDDEAAD